MVRARAVKRPKGVSAAAQPVSAPFRVSDAGIEWIKWLAFGAMIFDHVNWLWFARGGDPRLTAGVHPWMNDVGRLALPLFAFAFGHNLVRVLESDARTVRLRRMGRRLAVAGLAAQIPYWLLRGYFWPLNVVFLFGACAGLVVLWNLPIERHRLLVRSGVLVVGLVVGAGVEYWWLGMGVVLAAVAVARARSWGSLLIFVAALVPICLLNGNLYAVLAVVAIVAVRNAGKAPPRIPGLLYVLYPAHLWAMLALVTLFARAS